jgi:uncharacterized protein YndB with AHSA1/START domain
MKKQNTLVIERIFDAPVAKVWKAWTDPEEAKKWWGPKDFTAPSITIDFRVGGKYLFCMRGRPWSGGEPQDFWSTGTYKEIVPMKKLVMTDSFADEKGNPVSGEKYGMKGIPLELLVTIEFEDTGDGKTKMTLTHVGMPAGKHSQGAKIGWNQSFDKLAESLK